MVNNLSIPVYALPMHKIQIENISTDFTNNSRSSKCNKIANNNSIQFEGWVGFYGISTIVGYLMPNSIYYIKYMICKHILLIIFFKQA